MYYRGVYYKKYPHGFDVDELSEWLDKMYKRPPKVTLIETGRYLNRSFVLSGINGQSVIQFRFKDYSLVDTINKRWLLAVFALTFLHCLILQGVFERSVGDAPREEYDEEGEEVVRAEGLEDGELVITNSNYNLTLKRYFTQ